MRTYLMSIDRGHYRSHCLVREKPDYVVMRVASTRTTRPSWAFNVSGPESGDLYLTSGHSPPSALS